MLDSNLITSKDIFNKTGISETTLENFIILGILPKPIVKHPKSDINELTPVAYFPAEVLDRILQVKFVKQQENSMKSITRVFGEMIGAILYRAKKENSRNWEIIHPV